MTYWTTGYWRKDRDEALAIGMRLRTNVWAVPDGHNPHRGGYLILRWSTL